MVGRKKGVAGLSRPDEGGSTEDAFTKICEALADADYRKTLKLVDGVLETLKTDEDALNVKLFALLMIGRFAEALDLVRSSKPLQEQCSLEHAYCLYKCGKLDAALDLLGARDDEGSQQLAAMVHMRAGRTLKASELYHSLVPRLASDKQSAVELATNIIASLLLSDECAQIPSTLQQLRVTDRDSSEVAFNLACAAVLDGELDKATKLLQLAETKGNETLIEENATQGEIDEELGPVRSQAAYISLLQGDSDAAVRAFSAVLGQQVGTALQAVATNNMLCIRAMQSDAAFKEARRKLTSFIDSQTGSVTAALVQRLPRAAQTSIRHNHALTGLVLANSAGSRAAAANTPISQTCSTAQSLFEEVPDSQDALLLTAGASGLLHSADQGIRAVEAWVHENPGADATRALLMGAHIACSAQPLKLDVAITLLGHPRLSGSVRHAPAVLATRARLREKLALPDVAQESENELQAAIDWWTARAAGSERSQALSAFYEQQAALLLQKGELQAALQSLTALKEGGALLGSATEQARAARMIAAIEPDASAHFIGSVATSQDLSVVDVKEAEELEISSILSKGTSVLLGPYVRGSGAPSGQGSKPHQKRKRKPRYPKNFDPDNPGPPADPERWLPWHERAANKKRRKRRGNQPPSKGAQGMGTVDENLDKSHITIEDLDARAKQPSASKGPPRGAKSKRKGKR